MIAASPDSARSEPCAVECSTKCDGPCLEELGVTEGMGWRGQLGGGGDEDASTRGLGAHVSRTAQSSGLQLPWCWGQAAAALSLHTEKKTSRPP